MILFLQYQCFWKSNFSPDGQKKDCQTLSCIHARGNKPQTQVRKTAWLLPESRRSLQQFFADAQVPLTLQNPLNSRFATVLSNAYAVKCIRGKSATVAGRKTDECIPQLPFLDYIQQYRT